MVLIGCGCQFSIRIAACRCGRCFAHPWVAHTVIETARIAPAASNDRFLPALLALLIVISLASVFLMVLALAMIPTLPIVYFPLLQAGANASKISRLLQRTALAISS